MSHFKKFSEHRHGRDIAKQRVGGGPSGTQKDLSRIRDAGGEGRGIPGRANGGAIYGQGLASGGEVVNFPISQAMADARRNHFRMKHFGAGMGPYNPSAPRPSNVVHGPGAGGGGKLRPGSKLDPDEMPHARGGKVSSAVKAEIKSAIQKHDTQLHGEGKRTKLARGGSLPVAGAESGAGRMQLAKLQASRRKK